MANSLWNSGLYQTEKEYGMLNIHKGVLKGENYGSFGTPSNAGEHGKDVIVDSLRLDESGDAGC